MKKLSMYLVMLGIFFLGILSFSSNVFSSTLLTLGTGDTICSSIYAPVCGVLNTQLCYDTIGGTGGGCTTVPYYKTFGNECELGGNNDGFIFFKNGSCEVQKSITVTAPTSVEKGSTFTYSWNAVGGYEYCMPTGSIGADMASSGNGRLSLTGSISMSAPAITSTVTSLTVGVQCYYKDLRGFYMSDTKTSIITLTSNQCVQLGGAGPNLSLPPGSVNRDKICCTGLTSVTPISCYRFDQNTGLNTLMAGCGTICANVGDGICDSKYENSLNSKDCIVTRNMTLTAPSELPHGKSFIYKWNTSGYEYCNVDYYNMQGNKKELIFQMPKVELNSDAITTSAEDSSVNAIKIDLTCYYKKVGYEGVYTNDMTSKIITLKDGNQCVALGGSGPNWSLGPNDPNKDKKCCSGLTLVTPPSCNYFDPITGLTITKEGCGTICANVSDGVCDSYYENSLNSKDCVFTKSIILDAPSSVTKGTTFSYSWKAIGGYEYCLPKMNGSDFPSSGSGYLGIKGSLNVTAPAIGSTLSSMTVGVQCYYREPNSNTYKIDAKHTPITLINSEVCSSEGGEVCGVKFLQSCSQGSTSSSCKVIPIYKLFSNKCELNKNISGFTFYRNGNCDNIVDDTVKLTNNIKSKLDKSIKKLLEKIDQSYSNKTDKINAINVIIDKLILVQSNKPKYVNITKYVINKLNEEIVKINSEEDINIDEIINIFN